MLMQVFLSKKEIYEICALSNNDWNEKKNHHWYRIWYGENCTCKYCIQKSVTYVLFNGFGQSEDSQLKYAAGSKVIINV